MNTDMAQYLDIFLEESREYLENLNQRLLELEKNPAHRAGLNEVFRSAHTLKGMSATMGFEDMADLTHHMENLLEDLKEGVLGVNTYTIDVLFQCLDRLQAMVDQIRSGHSGAMDNLDLIEMLNQLKSGYVAPEGEGPAPSQRAAPAAPPPPSRPRPPVTLQQELDEYDVAIIREAINRSMQVLVVQVLVDPGCMMKGVRAFMVFKALEEDGEIIKADPPAHELEEGRYGDCFQLLYITSAEEQKVLARLDAISEVELGTVLRLDLPQPGEAAAAGAPAAAQEAAAPAGGNGPASEVPAARPAAPAAAAARQVLAADAEAGRVPRTRQTVRVDIEKLDSLLNLVGELVINKGRLEQIAAQQRLPELIETIEQVDRITTDLQNVVMKVRMVPVKQVFNRFPRMVRDLAHELGKEIDFIMEGEETELDRTVIDEIGDPLLHLLRNSIDHGMETPQEREALGKPRSGLLRLSARHQGNNVFIEVSDDGRGIDPAAVRARGVEKGFLSEREAEQMSDEAVIALLFQPGFSTAAAVTDISGRGVGLDVVKSKIEALNGEIAVDSRPGRGTAFRIRLPLTLAIIQALLVEVGGETYAIPLGSVDETTMVSAADLKTVQNQEVMLLRGAVLPLARLHSLLEVPGAPAAPGNGNGQAAADEAYVVVVRKGERQLGLVCDNLLGQQEIVIKSLGRLLAGTSGIAGATILGDGQVALILDVATLV